MPTRHAGFRASWTLHTLYAMLYNTAASHIPHSRVSATYHIALPGYETSWHEHEEFMFLLPKQGALTVNADSTDAQRVGNGQLAVVAPQRFHKTTSSKGAHCHTAIYVDRDFVSFCAQKANVRLNSGDVPTHCVPTPALLSALHLERSLQHTPLPSEDCAIYQRDLLDRLLAAACVESTLSALGDAPSLVNERQQWVDDMKHYLDSTLAERVNIDAVASAFTMSRRHLTRTFREETGLSITEYQTSQRVMRAAALLQVPGTTVLDAALQVGIDSPSYLARLFRKHGMPMPRAVKARNR